MADGDGTDGDRRAGEAMSKAEREEMLGYGEDGAPMREGRAARLARTDLELVDLDDPGDTEGLLVARDEEPEEPRGTERRRPRPGR